MARQTRRQTSRNARWIIIVLAAVIVLASGGATLFIMKKADGRQLFYDRTTKLSFLYPSNWHLTDKSTQEVSSVTYVMFDDGAATRYNEGLMADDLTANMQYALGVVYMDAVDEPGWQQAKERFRQRIELVSKTQIPHVVGPLYATQGICSDTVVGGQEAIKGSFVLNSLGALYVVDIYYLHFGRGIYMFNFIKAIDADPTPVNRVLNPVSFL